MLILYHNNQEIVLDNTEYYVRELASGLDEIIFDISIWDPNYALMNEEDNIVDRGGQRYLVKQIDAGAVTAKVVCQLDLDEWKATLSVGYDSGSLTVAQQIDAVKPTGWSVLDYSHISISRTIKGDLTPLQVCEECRNTYQVYVRWDNKSKKCYIYPQALGTPVGSFASRELNLKEINYKGKSQNFATRLYAYGKDGLSFADINSGKAYVDNNTYSSRVICAYWQDDRYTVAANLLADAQEKLAKLAVPERSYDCAIVDLKATNPDIYGNLDFSLFTTATLIDDIKGTTIDYMVVERHVWPYHPDRNDVIFNSSPVKIQNSVIQIEDEITNPQSTFQQIQSARIQEATDWLLNGDGYVVAVKDTQGNWKELLFMDTDDISTATNVIRINNNGIGFSTTGANGPYTNAWTIDGKLNADFILAGHLIADRIQGGTLESANSTSGIKNFILDMTTGAITAQNFSIITPNFRLSNSGVIKSMANASYPVTISSGGEAVILDKIIMGINSSQIWIEYNQNMLAPNGYTVFTLKEGLYSAIGGHGIEMDADMISIKPIHNNDALLEVDGKVGCHTISGGYIFSGSDPTGAYDYDTELVDGTALIRHEVTLYVQDNYLTDHIAFNGKIKDANGTTHSVINGIILDDEI